MQSENYVKRKDTVELIAFNTEEFMYEVQEKLDIWDISISCSLRSEERRVGKECL